MNSMDGLNEIHQAIAEHEVTARVSKSHCFLGLLAGEWLAGGLAFDREPITYRRDTCSDVGAASLAACALVRAIVFPVNAMVIEPVQAIFLELDLFAADELLMALIGSPAGFAQADALLLGKAGQEPLTKNRWELHRFGPRRYRRSLAE